MATWPTHKYSTGYSGWVSKTQSWDAMKLESFYCLNLRYLLRNHRGLFAVLLFKHMCFYSCILYIPTLMNYHNLGRS